MDLMRFVKDDFDCDSKISPKFALIFHGHKNVVNYVTHHQISKNGKIKSGVFVSYDSVEDMVINAVREQKSESENSFLPEHLLLDRSDKTIWYRKKQKRSLLFSLGNKNKNVTVNAHLPPLIFCRDGINFYIFAFKDNERPTPKTKLYNAPLMNIGRRGNLCLGMAELPKIISSNENILELSEGCFFDFHSTHVNHSSTIKSEKPVGTNYLFDYYKKKERDKSSEFNLDDLASSGMNLGDLI